MSPAISIDQKTTSRNPRSTVGTVTEIYDYLRLLYARIGQPYCPNCGQIIAQTVEQIVDRVMAAARADPDPDSRAGGAGPQGRAQEALEEIAQEGFVRVRVDGEMRTLDEPIDLEKKKKHTIEVVVDRIVGRGIETRLADSLETALALTGGSRCWGDGVGARSSCSARSGLPRVRLSASTSCRPRMFSFNSPYGACPGCDGLGIRMEVDPELGPDKAKVGPGWGDRPWASSHSRWLERAGGGLRADRP